jgi:hypothetical protein
MQLQLRRSGASYQRVIIGSSRVGLPRTYRLVPTRSWTKRTMTAVKKMIP